MKEIHTVVFMTIMGLMALMLIVLGTKSEQINNKEDVILEETAKEISVRKYTKNITIDKSLKKFIVKEDSTITKYPQKQILHEGILVLAKHGNDDVHIKDKKTKKIVDVSNYFTCSQVDEFITENKVGKNMIITKVYYPKERIFYKFQ